MVPDALKEAWEITNKGRQFIKKKPFEWHDKLHASCQEHCEWLWKTYTSGGDPTVNAHHDLNGRVERAGWVWLRADGSMLPHPPDSRGMIGNFSECGAVGSGGGSGKWPADPSGWSYPPKTAAAHAKESVWILTESNLADDQKEGHVWDFRSSWTHAAVGHHEGFFVVNYGYLPGGDPDPTPEPPDDEKPLNWDDFQLVGGSLQVVSQGDPGHQPWYANVVR